MLQPPNPPDALLTTGTSIQTTYQKTGDNTGTTTLFKIKNNKKITKKNKKMYKRNILRYSFKYIKNKEYSKAHA